jgi:hypothetical protein
MYFLDGVITSHLHNPILNDQDILSGLTMLKNYLRPYIVGTSCGFSTNPANLGRPFILLWYIQHSYQLY